MIGMVMLLAVLLMLFLPPRDRNVPAQSSAPEASADDNSGQATAVAPNTKSHYRPPAEFTPPPTAQEIVADKLRQFAQSRRDLMYALAKKRGIAVPDAAERFFEALASGDWNEIKARFAAISGGDSGGATLGRPADIQSLWPAIHDAYGAALTAQRWPAQQLLDYGSAVLDSLRPGMAYLGGTDSGRWIPELLNNTGDGERHIILTQNALADPNYLDYVNLQYGDQFAALSSDDANRAYANYLSDYQKRLAHDQQFPDEPAQIRPGESDGIKVGDDGQLSVHGPKTMVSVMAINDQLLQLLLQKNPDLSFAMEQSFPLPSALAGASSLGPIMELRASDGQNNLTADSAAQSLAYWQTTAQQLLTDQEVSAAPDTLKAYSHDLAAQAGLFASHDLSAQAEQAFQLANQLSPANPEVILGYTTLLVNQGRVDEARQLVQTAAGLAPNSQDFQRLLTQLNQRK
jgi:hypothetical protein